MVVERRTQPRAEAAPRGRGVERLRGVAVAWEDLVALAPALAAALGIRVLDAEA